MSNNLRLLKLFCVSLRSIRCIDRDERRTVSAFRIDFLWGTAWKSRVDRNALVDSALDRWYHPQPFDYCCWRLHRLNQVCHHHPNQAERHLLVVVADHSHCLIRHRLHHLRIDQLREEVVVADDYPD